MSSPLNDAASNALRIAGEFSLELDLLSFPKAPFPAIVGAAGILAAVEHGPGFVWNETTRNDWESVCAAIAGEIERSGTASHKFILRSIGIKKSKKRKA